MSEPQLTNVFIDLEPNQPKNEVSVRASVKFYVIALKNGSRRRSNASGSYVRSSSKTRSVSTFLCSLKRENSSY